MVRTYVVPLSEVSIDELLEMFEELIQLSLEKLEKSGLATEAVHQARVVDMRYEGQEHTVRVPVPSDEELASAGLKALQDRFDDLHKQAYAHASPGSPTELVNLRLSAIVESKKPHMLEIAEGSGDGSAALKAERKVFFKESEGEVLCPIYDRDKLGAGDGLDGPAIVEEWNSTVVVNPGHRLEVDNYGNLIIS